MKTTRKEINGIEFTFVNEEREPRTYVDFNKAYRTASIAKWNAWNEWKEACAKLGGYGYGVTGHNCYKFTLEFKFEYENVKYLAVITDCNNYLYLLKEVA